jgi:hypothetical protein
MGAAPGNGCWLTRRIQFAVARTTASSSRKDRSLTSVDVSLHPRTIRRSIMKVRLKQEEERVLKGTCSLSAEPPAYVQSKRYQWAQWWARQHGQLRYKITYHRMECHGGAYAWPWPLGRSYDQSGFFQ